MFFPKNESHNESTINLSLPPSDAFPLNRHGLNKQPKAPKIQSSQALKSFMILNHGCIYQAGKNSYDAQNSRLGIETSCRCWTSRFDHMGRSRRLDCHFGSLRLWPEHTKSTRSDWEEPKTTRKSEQELITHIKREFKTQNIFAKKNIIHSNNPVTTWWSTIKPLKFKEKASGASTPYSLRGITISTWKMIWGKY